MRMDAKEREIGALVAYTIILVDSLEKISELARELAKVMEVEPVAEMHTDLRPSELGVHVRWFEHALVTMANALVARRREVVEINKVRVPDGMTADELSKLANDVMKEYRDFKQRMN
jgi:hypothetical protein